MRVLGLGVALLLASCATSRADCGHVKIAEMSWGSAEVAADVVKTILEKGYGCRAELIPGDTVPTITAMSERSEPDIAPELWINAAKDVIERAVNEKRLTVAGHILADGGQEGWYVPRYMVEAHPELTTLEAVLKRPDLFPDPEEKGKGRFYSCPAGWACQIVNDNLYRAYGLQKTGFTKFDPGSGEGLAAAIARAYERKQPIFTYYFGPTAVLGKYPMVRLGGMTHDPASWPCMSKPECPDPKPNMYPPAEVIVAQTTKFAAAAPDAAAFLGKLSWKNDVVNELLAWKDDKHATGEETAERFLKMHEEVWTTWVNADVAAKVKKGL
jgi:glycine betaine/proline transport system substrate-binding protein